MARRKSLLRPATIRRSDPEPSARACADPDQPKLEVVSWPLDRHRLPGLVAQQRRPDRRVDAHQPTPDIGLIRAHQPEQPALPLAILHLDPRSHDGTPIGPRIGRRDDRPLQQCVQFSTTLIGTGAGISLERRPLGEEPCMPLGCEWTWARLGPSLRRHRRR